MPIPSELIYDIQNELTLNGIPCDVRVDPTTRLLYSTDASIYQVEPLGVAFPRTVDELAGLVEIAARYDTPLLPRGSGSSLAGQAIGPALILDCSRYLNQIVSIDPEAMTAVVEPGLILAGFNKALAPYGLQFGPDPASAERATMGGSLANNASGAHSLLYGMAADHLLSAEVILADGSVTNFSEIPLEQARRKANGDVVWQKAPNLGEWRMANENMSDRQGDNITAFSPGDLYRLRPSSLESNIYAAALHIKNNYADMIKISWPQTWRKAAGYGLNYLLPWSPSKPRQWVNHMGKRKGDKGSIGPSPLSLAPYPLVSPGSLNLAPLLAGSEGTLAVIQRATVRLVRKPRYTVLGVLAFTELAAACDATPALLEQSPSAVELIPRGLIHLARSVPAYAHLLSSLKPLVQEEEPAALLVVEFSGDDPSELKEKTAALGRGVLVVDSPSAQKNIWAVRAAGLGILMSRPGDLRPTSFIEDLAVPVERLGEFVREMDRILAAYGSHGDFYAHASAGCLHLRPMMNLKTQEGVANLRAIAREAVDLTLRLGGTPSGEHGTGMARGEWLEHTYGTEVMMAFRELKQAADPKNLLNPGKVIDAPPMDANLRYGSAYQAKAWTPVMGFEPPLGVTVRPGEEGPVSLLAAIELCNGAGVCRKVDGVMCPSFQATQEEMHSTRGRANLLRAMVSGPHLDLSMSERAAKEALDLCLACKGCKSECPSGVDMAKLKYEFTNRYYQRHSRSPRDYLFGYIGPLLKLGAPFGGLVNRVTGSSWFRSLGEKLLGLAPQRPFPKFGDGEMRKKLASRRKQPSPPAPLPTLGEGSKGSQGGSLQPLAFIPPEDVFFLSDSFNEYFYPEVVLAALDVLERCGCRVRMLPVMGAGRTLISKGFLPAARQYISHLVKTLQELDPDGRIPVVGVEPSEIYTLRDELPDLLSGDAYARELARRSYMIDEFLVRPGLDGKPRLVKIVPSGENPLVEPRKQVLLHGHCYQKAQPPAADGYPNGVAATMAMLKAVGYDVNLVESSCCGMAGAFGYEVEHYDLSVRVGEMSLLPAVRTAASEVIVAASGVSCKSQIEDGAQRKTLHSIQLMGSNLPPT